MRRTLFAMVVVLLASATPASARSREALELALARPRVRTNGPILTQAQFAWTGRGLLEGRLELELKAGRQSLATYRTHDMALTTGQTRFDLLLPAVPPDLYDNRLDVHARFLTRREAFRFPPTQWLLPRATERGCVLCVCHGPLGWNEHVAAVARALHLERFRPRLRDRTAADLMTTHHLTGPEGMPSQPLAYCAFDVVLLTERGFNSLGSRELEALAKWVRAGGSVCVVAGAGLAARHAEFANALADGPTFRLDAEGRLVRLEGEPAAEGIHLLHACLGRAAVVTQPPEKAEEVESRAWRRLNAFLWRIRRKQIPHVLSAEGVWSRRLQSNEYAQFAEAYNLRSWGGRDVRGEAVLALYPMAFASIDQILAALMPERVRVMPFGVVVLLLLAFTACIGPLDYLVLGHLRLRKLTWVTFPLLAVAFTWFTVRLAEHYMGLEDHRRAIVFVDLDRRGEPVRESRYQFIFSAGERDERLDLHDALYYSMGRGELAAEPWRMAQMGLRVRGETEPLDYQGRIPGHYVVAQRIRRYKPYLNKAFSLEPSAPSAGFDWEAAAMGDASPAGMDALRRAVRQAMRGTGAAYLFHGDRMVRLAARGDFPVLTRADRSGFGPMAGLPLLQVACVRPQVGLFSVVSQISPTGAPDFEDLALLDPTDPDQWLLVLIERHGDDLYVYRRLYRKEP